MIAFCLFLCLSTLLCVYQAALVLRCIPVWHHDRHRRRRPYHPHVAVAMTVTTGTHRYSGGGQEQKTREDRTDRNRKRLVASLHDLGPHYTTHLTMSWPIGFLKQCTLITAKDKT